MRRINPRHAEARQRALDRRRREDEAPRLLDEVPFLESLCLRIQERRTGMVVAESMHVRRIAVARAPALFELPCLEPACKEGGHDVTSMILSSLRAGLTRFEGEDACPGQTGSAPCQRVLHFVAEAVYRE